ncbi:MAG TPA: ABC transporter substrate-binding protein, partial [Ilumatobacteraceae bacterium]|nr:ABC transporter substrate-binding protein [Ilumatobacteraceae bacterium]
AGAWLPEPWATRLIIDAGAKVLVDEADLWPSGKFVTTQLIVSTEFLNKHPQQVHQLIEGELAALDEIANDPAKAQLAANEQIAAVTGKRLPDTLITAAWPKLDFTYDPIASSLRTAADHAHSVGLLDRVDLSGIYDLTILNQVLADRKLEPVKGLS